MESNLTKSFKASKIVWAEENMFDRVLSVSN